MNEESYLLFEQYLNNEMNFEEKESFENDLKSNVEMFESFEIYKDLNGYLKNKFENESNLKTFKENLNNAAGANDKKFESKIFSIKPIYYAIAACFALIFGIIFFNQNNSTPTFNDYYQQQTANFSERGDVIKILKQAQDAFNKDDYKLAASLFETILKSYPRPEIEFFYGISLMQINKFYESEKVFYKLIDGNSIFKNNAYWNLALLKLKQKDFESCKKILLQIPKDFENYNQVEKLLSNLP
jgi:TolA-binding protein